MQKHERQTKDTPKDRSIGLLSRWPVYEQARFTRADIPRMPDGDRRNEIPNTSNPCRGLSPLLEADHQAIAVGMHDDQKHTLGTGPGPTARQQGANVRATDDVSVCLQKCALVDHLCKAVSTSLHVDCSGRKNALALSNAPLITVMPL